MKDKIRRIIEESIQAKKAMDEQLFMEIEKTANAVADTFRRGQKVLIFGNGGSAADSQHIAAELVGRFKKERKAYPAIALTTNTSILTALANDYDYECIFQRQIEALAEKGDLSIGISTSGKAKNVILGLEKSRALGLFCVSFTGENGMNLKKISDICLIAPSKNTPRIQEIHITIGHIICELVEEMLA